MEFLNRSHETQILTPLLSRKKPSFIVIYGRRRCGKTTLIHQVLKKGDVFYQSDRQESAVQREQLVKTVGEVLEIPYEAIFRSWEALLMDLNRILSHGQTLVLDEFPYILKNEPELPSILQRLIDGKKLTYNLIVCGSSQNSMSEMVRSSQEPLYGRADAILKIMPLAPGWILDGLNLAAEEGIREFSIWGGVPRYWELRSDYKSLESALSHLVFRRDSILQDEPMRLLHDNLRSAIQPYTILTMIGQGVHRPSEIAGRLGKGLSGLADSFQKLIELGFIRREIPFGESIRSSKRTVYKIDDPFMAFYFRFVLPNKQRIDMGMGDRVLKQVLLHLDEFVASEWEHLCRTALPFLSIQGMDWDLASRWWGAGLNAQEIEIDGVAQTLDKKHILFAEAKWSLKPDPNGALAQLEKNIDNCKKFGSHKVIKVLFTRREASGSGYVEQFTPRDVLQVLK